MRKRVLPMNKILAMNLDRSDLPGTALKLVQLVRISGSTIVRGVPVSDDAMTLKTIAQLIGTPSTSRLSSVSPSGEIVVQSEFIHRVASFKEPLRKPGGQPVLSTTTAAFRLHTDEYFLSQPSDLVMMLCVAPDPSGRGESSIAHVDDVVAALPADAARALRARIFPRGVDRIPILRRVRRVNRIQYNGDDIREHYAETGEEIPGAIAFSTAALD